ncbi:MAG: hypothetical protein D6731_05740, partial [Planctomycetota bacterium]
MGAAALAPAMAQEAPLALVGARIAGRPGPQTVLIAGGKIRAIASRMPLPPGVRRLDLGGRWVEPGRIDAWASLGNPDPRGNALDAFDPYDEAALRRAWRGGVTTAILTPYRGAGNSGMAAAVKLRPGPLGERVVAREVALCSSLGLGRSPGPATSAGSAQALRKLLRGALAYRDAWDEYREKLASYEKALAEKAKAKGKGSGEKGKGSGEKGKEGAKTRPRGPT